MQRQYHHPLEKGFAERIHTPGGVRSLVEESHLMTLLRQLNEDGFNVDGPMAEIHEGSADASRLLCGKTEAGNDIKGRMAAS